MSKPKSAKVDIEPGLYFFTLKIVADIGTQTVKKFDSDEEEEKKQVILVVEVPELSTKGKPVTLSKWATNSSSPRSFGGKMMKAMGLNPATADWDDCLGKSFQAPVDHTESGNPKIGDPIAIKKSTKGPPGFIKETQSIYLDDNYSREAFEAMPEFIQNSILKSAEFEEIDAKRSKGKGKTTATSKTKSGKK
jgi:hypothetical protein